MKPWSHGGDVLEVVDEYVEREKRKNNLIIQNLPEPTEVLSNEQRDWGINWLVSYWV